VLGVSQTTPLRRWSATRRAEVRQMEDMNRLQAKLRRAQFRLPGTWLPAVRFSIGFPRLGRLRPGVLFGSGDFGRRRPPRTGYRDRAACGSC
jgi:hypothetical protein